MDVIYQTCIGMLKADIMNLNASDDLGSRGSRSLTGRLLICSWAFLGSMLKYPCSRYWSPSCPWCIHQNVNVRLKEGISGYLLRFCKDLIHKPNVSWLSDDNQGVISTHLLSFLVVELERWSYDANVVHCVLLCSFIYERVRRHGDRNTVVTREQLGGSQLTDQNHKKLAQCLQQIGDELDGNVELQRLANLSLCLFRQLFRPELL